MADAIELVLQAKEALIPGGLPVRRAIPQIKRRMVGPFVFVDQMGPVALEAAREIAVLPHPHIGLSTLTYLFEGEGTHRDSLGTVQRILPGEVNWMTAGEGIAHSERMRGGAGGRLSGVQIWVALPLHLEECEPSFRHYGADAVPVLDEGKAKTRLIAGSLFGMSSGVEITSPLFYAESRMEAGARFHLPPAYEERAAYVLEGEVLAQGLRLPSGALAVFRRGEEISLEAHAPCHLLLFGGEPLEGPRHISWNFVSSSKERLARAAEDWRQQRFGRVPDESAYIPLPRDGSEPVNYP